MINRALVTQILSFSCLIVLAACSGSNGSSTHAPDGGLPATYRSPDGSFSIRHPDGWGVAEGYVLMEQTGTALLAPVDTAETTLREGIFHIAKVDICAARVIDENITINDRTWGRSSWGDAGAGNLYEGETYTTNFENGCLEVTFYAHSCNLSPEDCGPTKPQKYDKGALFGIMRQMLETLKLQ